MQAMPPVTTEKRRLVSDASTPASRLPSEGALATCASSIPDMRPRIASGVACIRIVERRTALTKSAAPASPRKTSASPSCPASPKQRIAAPQSAAPTQTPSPCRRTWPTHPDSSEAASAPTYGAA